MSSQKGCGQPVALPAKGGEKGAEEAGATSDKSSCC